jgi:lipopolysaccharide export LptBFGC system permease protein LptF
MRLLDRYLLRELLTPLGYCLGGFLVFWISYDVFTELMDFQERKLHLLDVVEYYAAVMPGFVVTVLPMALLLALLYTLANHARHNEIAAIRAAGVSLWRLCLPYLFVGFAASLVLFVLNEMCAPHSDDWAERILNRHVLHPADVAAQNQFRNFGFTNAREHRAWLIGEYRVKTAEMLKPQVDWIPPDGSSRRLYAERAIRTNGVWTFFDVKEYAQTGADTPLLPSFQTSVIICVCIRIHRPPTNPCFTPNCMGGWPHRGPVSLWCSLRFRLARRRADGTFLSAWPAAFSSALPILCCSKSPWHWAQAVIYPHGWRRGCQTCFSELPGCG